MDIFKQKHYLVIVVIILIVLNIGTLLMLWLEKPKHSVPSELPKNIGKERGRVENLLKNEFDFDEEQVESYLQLRKELKDKVRRLDEEIRHLKGEMFDEVLEDNPRIELSDSLLSIVQNKQAEIEKLTFRHFLDLKKLCNPEQQGKLRMLMHDLFRMNQPGRKGGPPPHPPGGARQRPPRK